MARYNGPACRLCRRVGEKLFLKGERCYTPRCAVDRRHSPPGEQAANAGTQRRRRISEHGTQLREKQKARYVYGTLERQFSNYMDAASSFTGVTGDRLMQLLERRLDNVVYRLAFSESRNQSRQLVNHGHFQVNGRKVNIPSFMVKPGDVISWREQSRSNEYYKTMKESWPKRTVPGWLQMNAENVTGTVAALPAPAEIDTKVDTRLIVEFYSRR
ncbi:MAG: 30S ribosomal protein S4 [Chloroflexi bacterium]|nr:30S ribosomal protein S4 [Chloroflexota bacterium]